jgi:hypothetical protein
MRGVWLMIVMVVGCERTREAERIEPAAPAPVEPVPQAMPVEPAVPPVDPRVASTREYLVCNVDDGEVLTPHAPSAADVQTILSRHYREPKRLRIALQKPAGPPEPNVLRWERTYDGVRVNADTLSVEAKGGWCTRFKRELGEPARVRRAALISSDMAIAKSGLATTMVELVHDGVYKQLQRPGTAGGNAMDYEHVLERTELVYIVGSPFEEHVHVDPYAGTVVKRIERRRH